MPKVIQSANIDREVAELFAEQLRKKPASVLGLATGSTPVGIYRELIRMKPDFSRATTFNLDEYVGLDRLNHQSYYYFMHENLFNHVNVKEGSVNFLNGMAPNIDQEVRRYEGLMKQHPIDIQLLGIGSNGHIAFNEPGTALDSITHQTTLTQQTISDNSRFFAPGEFQPTTALTMGIHTIMQAKMIVLVAKGAGKSEAVRAALHGPQSPDCPASFLQAHPNCVFYVDEEVQLK